MVVWFWVKGWFQGSVKEFTSAGFLSAGAGGLLWAARAVSFGRFSGVLWAHGHVVCGAANAEGCLTACVAGTAVAPPLWCCSPTLAAVANF